ISWEKWVDPFGKDLDEAKWTDYNNDIVDPIELLNNEASDEDEDEIVHPQNRDPIKVIASPLGLIPYNEHTAPGKIFNFWLGHTNFNITEQVKNIIEQSDGVEILDVFTRYRFRIAIGKCFNDSEIMKHISDKISNI
ncbi:MAG: hypothetical protein ACO3UU_15740, partial [Minisyncoccia bacterium]